MGISINTVTNGEFTMRYIKFGAGARNFVIIPGLSVKSVLGSADAIVKQYQPMTDKYTVWLFDRRENVPESYSVHDMASDTAEAMKILGIADADVFGASQGGMIAMVIAIEHPDIVHKMVLGSSSANLRDHKSATLQRWVRLAREGDKVGLCLNFGKELYPKEFFEQYEEAFAALGKSVTDEELKKFIILAEGAGDFYIADDLPHIKCPVLAIGASDDRVLPPGSSEEIIASIGDRPDCKYYIYDNYGHAAFDMAPDYKDRMMEFLCS